MRPAPELAISWLGRVPYDAALERQAEARAAVAAGEADRLLLLEHPSVVTLGRRGGIVDRDGLARLDTPVVETDRGGLATWHGPGQLVGYPIVDLARRDLSVPAFVRALGALMVSTCEALGLDGVAYDDARPGVYRGGRKLGSIGLHVQRGVTTHGFALNVDIAFDGFQAITPCGDATLDVTSITRETGNPASLADAVAIVTSLAPTILFRPT